MVSTCLSIAIDGGDNDFTQCIDFDFIGALLKPRSELLDTWILGAALEYDGVAGGVRRRHRGRG